MAFWLYGFCLHTQLQAAVAGDLAAIDGLLGA